MEPKQILEQARKMIQEHASDDPDRWWYANRFVFSRLMLDERKTKTGVKQRLQNSDQACHACGRPFDGRKDVHLHRLNTNKGYSDRNCVLMHAECHRVFHTSQPSQGPDEIEAGEPVLVKSSKRYDDKSFLYWWDIAPPLAQSLDKYDSVEFVQKDTSQRCTVPVESLKGMLIPQRQTARGQGNWGIKVLKDRPDKLAFEPGNNGNDWLFLPVVWLEENED